MLKLRLYFADAGSRFSWTLTSHSALDARWIIFEKQDKNPNCAPFWHFIIIIEFSKRKVIWIELSLWQKKKPNCSLNQYKQVVSFLGAIIATEHLW